MYQANHTKLNAPLDDDSFNLLLKKSFIAGLVFLSPLTAIKLGEVESVEIYSLIALLVGAAGLYHNELRLRASRQVLFLLKGYFCFLVAAAVLALWALHLPTFPPPDVPFINTAPYISFARLIQFSSAIGALLLIAELTASRPSFCPLAAQCYVYAGVISSLYGLISWFALVATGIHLGGAYGTSLLRARGFFVEGGPFGVYLVSVILVCMFRRQIIRCGDPRAYWFQMALFLATLAAAASKAAILVIVLLGLYHMYRIRRIRYLVVMAPLLIGLALAANFTVTLRNYAENYVNFSRMAAQHPYDTNIIEGRLMAAILVPVMVAHHPVAGVGIGNYSLQRNNPAFLGSLPPSLGWDLPGLGLIGYAAELGIPLLLFLYWLLWRPVSIARRVHASPIVISLAAYQTFAHTLGVQPTFVYPWIVSGIALGYCLTIEHVSLTQTDPHPQPFD